MKILVLLVCMIFSLISEAKIYKSVDENGVTTYSDGAIAGGVEILINETQNLSWKKHVDTFETTDEEVSNAEEAPSEQSIAPEVILPAEFKYTELTISSPTNEEYIRSNQGDLNVVANIAPPRRMDDKVKVILDGRPLDELESSDTFTLKDIERGKHHLMLQLIDPDGKMLIRSKTVGFFMYRNIRYQNKPNQAV